MAYKPSTSDEGPAAALDTVAAGQILATGAAQSDDSLTLVAGTLMLPLLCFSVWCCRRRREERLPARTSADDGDHAVTAMSELNDAARKAAQVELSASA